MTELVSGMPAGMNLGECEDQSWFMVQEVDLFRFD
jgi:hypothetical protein